MFKKLIKAVLVPSIIMSIFYSCENEIISSSQESSSTSKMNTQDKISTNEINQDLLSTITGITAIEKISNNERGQEFRLIATSKVVNNYGFDLNDLTVFLQEDINSKTIKFSTNENGLQSEIFYYFSTDSNSKKAIDLTNKQIIDETYLDDEKNNVKYQIALLVLTKIEEGNIKENGFIFNANNSNSLSKKACERTITSLRYSRSSASNHVKSATDKFIAEHPDCKRVDGVDAGCLWEDYGCVATQAISCSGGGCTQGYGQL